MEDLTSDLWALEREFWLGGVDVYRQHLANDALMVFPGKVLNPDQTVESISSAPRWSSVSFSAQRLLWLTHDAAALVYRAVGSRGDKNAPYAARVSSVYVKQGDEWKLKLHQQSPE
jgi:hypothetical protein